MKQLPDPCALFREEMFNSKKSDERQRQLNFMDYCEKFEVQLDCERTLIWAFQNKNRELVNQCIQGLKRLGVQLNPY